MTDLLCPNCGVADTFDTVPLNAAVLLMCVACGKAYPRKHWLPLDVAEAGRKDDRGKNELDLLPARAIEAMGRVLTFGARKYAPDNWRKVPNGRKRYTAACLRHIFAAMRGEKCDPETGESHWAHAMTCAAFIIELEQE